MKAPPSHYQLIIIYFRCSRGLADTDADGKMTLMEFSIACKLINLKLRGFEVPKQIPPTLLCSLTTAGGTPIMTPPGQMSPLIFNRPVIPPQPQILQQKLQQQQQPPIIPPQPHIPPAIPPQPSMVTAVANAPPAIPPQPIIPPVIPPQPIIPPQPLVTASIPPAIPPQPMNIPAQPPVAAPVLPAALTSPIQATAAPTHLLIQAKKPSGGNLLDNLDGSNDMSLLTNGAAPKPPSQPGTRSGSISEPTTIPYEAK